MLFLIIALLLFVLATAVPDLQMGDRVVLEGTITHLNVSEHRPADYHSATVQLSDGQGVQTNLANLRLAVEPDAPLTPETPEEPKQKAPAGGRKKAAQSDAPLTPETK